MGGAFCCPPLASTVYLALALIKVLTRFLNNFILPSEKLLPSNSSSRAILASIRPSTRAKARTQLHEQRLHHNTFDPYSEWNNWSLISGALESLAESVGIEFLAGSAALES